MCIVYAHLHSCLITYFIFVILHVESIVFKNTKKKKFASLKIAINYAKQIFLNIRKFVFVTKIKFNIILTNYNKQRKIK